MASLASCALRSASRLGSVSASPAVAAAPLRGLPRAARVVAKSRRTARRGYVTETRKDNAKVETAIKLDKKDFADIPPPQMGAPSNAAVSPMAGTLPLPSGGSC